MPVLGCKKDFPPRGIFLVQVFRQDKTLLRRIPTDRRITTGMNCGIGPDHGQVVEDSLEDAAEEKPLRELVPRGLRTLPMNMSPNPAGLNRSKDQGNSEKAAHDRMVEGGGDRGNQYKKKWRVRQICLTRHFVAGFAFVDRWDVLPPPCVALPAPKPWHKFATRFCSVGKFAPEQP